MDAWQDEFIASVPNTDEDQAIAHTFTARINQLGAKAVMKPKSNRKCLFCDDHHTFDDCPYYQNKPYLQSCTVGLQQLLNKVSNARRRLQESSDFPAGRS